MKHERDIDRLLDHWLSDGPTEVSDRVVLDVADRIERQPQRPAWRFLRRPTPMSSSSRWAAVLVALALMAVVGFAVFGRTSELVIGGMAPRQLRTPTDARERPMATPSALRRRWPASAASPPTRSGTECPLGVDRSTLGSDERPCAGPGRLRPVTFPEPGSLEDRSDHKMADQRGIGHRVRSFDGPMSARRIRSSAASDVENAR